MFLALTAEEALWPDEGPVLFLGEWCRLHRRRARWESLRHSVVPYPFDDRARLFEAYRKLNTLYPAAVRKLGRALDALHGERHEPRYWEIVVGYWLRLYVEVLFERYTCLSAAVEEHGASRTRVPTRGSGAVPRDSAHFERLYLGDRYNGQLYGSLIRETGILSYEEVELGPLPDPRSRYRNRRVVRKARRWIGRGARRLARRNGYFLTSCYFPIGEYARLSARLRQFPLLELPPERPPSVPTDRAARSELAAIEGESEFETLVYRTLADNLPAVFLEGYAELGRSVGKLLPEKPRLVMTANAFAVDDAFKRWAAEQTEKGTPYALLQHGGSYGWARWNSSEDYEARTADVFYTYGWTDERDSVRPFPASRFVGRSRRSKSHSDGPVLWVLASFPRYAYTMYSVPVGPQFLDYLEEQRRFYDALDDTTRRRLLVRPYPIDYGWDDLERIREGRRSLRVASLSEGMRSQMRRSSLMVATFSATAFMEGMVEDVPTVMFWKPAHWEVRPAAKPYFDRLRDAGILHDTPESAARAVARHLEDPSWWGAAGTRRARGEFLERYGRVREDALDLWVREIRRLGQNGASAAPAAP